MIDHNLLTPQFLEIIASYENTSKLEKLMALDKFFKDEIYLGTSISNVLFDSDEFILPTIGIFEENSLIKRIVNLFKRTGKESKIISEAAKHP
jgi:hypothetical protein